MTLLLALSLSTGALSYRGVVTHNSSVKQTRFKKQSDSLNLRLETIQSSKLWSSNFDDSLDHPSWEPNLNRRNVLSVLGMTMPALSIQPSSAQTQTQLVADLPMKRLKLPRGALGRDYIVIPLKVNGKGPFEFMVDSGLTTELITPHLQSILGIKSGRRKVQGIAAGGANLGSLVELNDASLCCGDFVDQRSEYPLPKLYAVVTDFPQEHIDPAHDPVEGMLGMEFLELFDVEFDFKNKRLRLWEHGLADTSGMVAIPAAVLNESGLLGIRVISANRPLQQPMIGILDCGASFSSVNVEGAKLMGVSANPADHLDTPTVTAMGVDGRPIQMVTAKIPLSFVGNVNKENRQFEQPPQGWKPWEPVLMGVGDLSVFSDLLGDERGKPFTGPAALVGLDVLSQRRFVLGTTGPGRSRTLYVAPS